MTDTALSNASRIRVCHVITRLDLGGAQQNTLFTVAHLDRGRFAPSLVAGRGGMLDRDAARIPDLSVTFVPDLVRQVAFGSDVRALLSLVRTFRRLRPDIVHTHSSKAGILGRWAAWCAGVPVVVHTIHGYGFHAGQRLASYWLFRGAETLTAAVTDRFIAVARADLESGVEWSLFPRERAVLIRSGIELSAFGNDGGSLRTELGVPADVPVVGMVACLKPQKAPLDFVRMAAQVCQRVPSAHFVLVGDGELRPQVQREVTRHGLRARFHLLGWRHDVPSILTDLNVFVLTSRWEGLPRAVPEAMAALLPVVATRVNGTPEAVADGVTGYLVDPGDVGAMAERVVALLERPVEARRMGRNGHARVKPFDIDLMVGQQETLYVELAARRGLPAGTPCGSCS